MSFYRRNLPHWQPNQAEYFITSRLVNSLPAKAVKRLKRKREYLQKSGQGLNKVQQKIFANYENLLDGTTSGSTWLNNEAVAKVVYDALRYRDQNEYDLYAFCIMPNHIHIVFKLLNKNQEEYPITKILQELKRYTARECNKLLSRKGQFWQHESFDRVIRNQQEKENTIKYVLNNPVKAGLVKEWRDWSMSYCKAVFEETI